MKCQSKIEVSLFNTQGKTIKILIKGNMYECELTPTIYDINTYKPTEPHYIVTCEDKMYRKYNADYFITPSELRENKLNELGI